MANIGTLMAYVGLDGSAFIRGAKETEKHIVDLSSQLSLLSKSSLAVSNSLGFVSSALKTVAATLAIDWIAGHVKEVTFLAARYDTLGVSMRAVGNNAGYTFAQMKEYEESLRKTGISAMESRQTLLMMASAQMDLTKASKLARIAQDAAVIGNINSSEAFERMIYGIHSASVVVLRHIGINVSFERSYKRLADALGKNVDSLTEEEQVQARVNAVMEAGTKIAGTYEAAMGTAGKQYLSIKRYIDDLKESLGQLFQNSYLVAVKSYTAVLKQAAETLEEFKKTGEDKRWSEYFATGTEKVIKALTHLVEIISFLRVEWYAVKLVVSEFISFVSAAFTVLAQNLQNLFPTLSLIFIGLEKLGMIEENPFETLAKSTEEFAKASILLSANVEKELKKVEESHQDIEVSMGAARRAISAIVDESIQKEIDVGADKIVKSIDKISDATAKLGSKELEKLMKESQDRFELDEKAWGSAAEHIEHAYAETVDLTEVQEDLNREAERLDDLYVKTYAETLPKQEREIYEIQMRWKQVNANIDELDKNTNASTQTIADMHTRAAQRMQEDIDTIGNRWNTVLEGIKDAFQQFFDWSHDSFLDLGDLMKNIGSSLSKEVSGEISKSIWSIFKGISSGTQVGGSSPFSGILSDIFSTQGILHKAGSAAYSWIGSLFSGSTAGAATGAATGPATYIIDTGMQSMMGATSGMAGVRPTPTFSPGVAGAFAAIAALITDISKGVKIQNALIHSAGTGLGAWGGAAAGAYLGAKIGGTIGTYILPGIGTAIGAMLGSALSKFLIHDKPKHSKLGEVYKIDYNEQWGIFKQVEKNVYKANNEGYSSFNKVMEGLSNNLVSWLNAIKNKLAPAFETFSDTFKEKFENFLKNFSSGGEGFIRWDMFMSASNQREMEEEIKKLKKQGNMVAWKFARGAVQIFADGLKEKFDETMNSDLISILNEGTLQGLQEQSGDLFEKMLIGSYGKGRSLTGELNELDRSYQGLNDIITYLTEINSAYSSARDYINELIDPMNEWEKTISEIETKVAEMILTLGQYGVSQERLNEIYESSREAIEHLNDEYAQEEFSNIIEPFLSNINKVKENFAGMIDTIKQQRSGMSKEDYILSKINIAIASNDAVTVSQLANDWYNAAMQTATDEAAIIDERIQNEKHVAELWLDVSNQVEELSRSIDQTILGIKYSGLNLAIPREIASQATFDYDRLLAEVKDKKTSEALSSLTSFASVYLQEQQDSYKSSQTYLDKYASVIEDLQEVQDLVESADFERSLFDQKRNEELLASTEKTEINTSSINEQIMNWSSWAREISESQLSDIRTQNDILSSMIEKLDRPINVTVEVGGEEFEGIISSIADGIRVQAARRNIGALATT